MTGEAPQNQRRIQRQRAEGIHRHADGAVVACLGGDDSYAGREAPERIPKCPRIDVRSADISSRQGQACKYVLVGSPEHRFLPSRPDMGSNNRDFMLQVNPISKDVDHSFLV